MGRTNCPRQTTTSLMTCHESKRFAGFECVRRAAASALPGGSGLPAEVGSRSWHWSCLNFGEKTKMPKINPQDWQTQRRADTPCPQHGPVAAQGNQQIKFSGLDALDQIWILQRSRQALFLHRVPPRTERFHPLFKAPPGTFTWAAMAIRFGTGSKFAIFA